MVATVKRSRKKTSSIAGGAPARRGNLGLLAVVAGLVVVNLYVFLWRDGTSLGAVKQRANEPAAIKGPDLAPAAAVLPTPTAADEGPAEPAPVTITGTVGGKYNSLGKILKKEGLTPSETDELLRSLTEVLDFRKLRDGQAYSIVRGPDGRVTTFELQLSKLQTVRSMRDPTGALVGVADKAQTRTEVIEVGGKIDSSLYASIKSAGENTALVGFFVDVFAYDLDFYNDTHEGDEFRVLVEKEYKGAEFLHYGRIISAEYKGKAGTFRALWWAAPGASRGRYYDDKGQTLERTLLKTPLKFTRISSKFDRNRMHPILHTTRAHLGMDYAAPTGTPVWAAASGRITTRSFDRGAGNMVIISHDNGLATIYMHLSKFAAGQKVGDRVEAKTVIGYVGTTGLSTGPHLHFGVKQNGSYVDPQKLTPARLGGIAKRDIGAFRAHASAVIDRLHAISTKPVVSGTPSDEPALPEP